jgi:hypothetical protein
MFLDDDFAKEESIYAILNRALGSQSSVLRVPNVSSESYAQHANLAQKLY